MGEGEDAAEARDAVALAITALDGVEMEHAAAAARVRDGAALAQDLG